MLNIYFYLIVKVPTPQVLLALRVAFASPRPDAEGTDPGRACRRDAALGEPPTTEGLGAMRLPHSSVTCLLERGFGAVLEGYQRFLPEALGEVSE